MNYSIIIPSNNPMLGQQAKNCLPGLNVTIFNGNGYLSYAKLINDCILSAKEEVVIILNHKTRPSPLHIYKIMHLLHMGYGLVCLQYFHLYGFKKDLIRKIGFFDERFIGGGQEDRDFCRRLIENDIAIYESAEVPEVYMKSSWNGSTALDFYTKKWSETQTHWKRILPDEQYDYDLGPTVSSNCNWLPFKNSILLKTSLPSHKQVKYFNDKPIDLSNLSCS
jgi:GT2 family glycosyltransferase